MFKPQFWIHSQAVLDEVFTEPLALDGLNAVGEFAVAALAHLPIFIETLEPVAVAT
jgi:hypothetical protein